MTRYFEVQQRDGAARMGKLLLRESIQTPHIVDTQTFGDLENSPIVDAGSLWRMGSWQKAREHLEEIRNTVGEDTLVILPHQSFSPAVYGHIPEAPEDLDTAEGARGNIFRKGKVPSESDLYIIEGVGTLENNARAFMDTLLDLKRNTRPDTAVYAPNICLPENLAMLVYLGIDIVDDTKSVVSAYNDIYLTTSGSFHLDRLGELPCRCGSCASIDIEELRQMDKKQRAQLLAEHNRNILESEMALVRERIRSGNLREYVEGQCRTRPWLTALLRLADQEYDYLESNTPIARSNQLIANTSESLTRPEVVRFAERVLDRYSPPEVDILLLLPCSARKPYSISNSHQRFIRALGKSRKFVHEMIVTSPMGIVPRELELTYPAAHYDTAVTGYWDAEEREWVAGVLEKYLSKHSYQHVVAHVEGAYRQICETVAERLGIEIIYTSTGSAASGESLSNLKETVAKLCTGRSRDQKAVKRDNMRAIADYQFGVGSGELLIPDNVVMKAPYPKYQAFVERKQVATLVPQYGTLAMTIDGAKLLLPEGRYIVNIDDFVPKGSLLAPGVTKADPIIRPGGEVIISGEKAIGVGKAMMCGREMQESTRGVAVDLRKAKKK